MKKPFLIAVLLMYCSFQSMAQYRVYGLSGSNVQGNYIPGSNSIIIGGSTTTNTGVNSVVIGNGTASTSNTGDGNTFVGTGTAVSNTSGYANTFLGTWNAQANTTGYANTFVGQWCGSANTTGIHNSFLGQGAGGDNTTGTFNVFIGTGAGNNNTTGTSNTVLGASGGFSTGGLHNVTVIGANAQGSVDNTMILGGTGANAVDVGLGTSTPAAHLHTVNDDPEDVIFSTTNTGSSSASTLLLETPSSPYPYNDTRLFTHGSGYTGNFLPGILANSAPIVPEANMAGLLTDGSPLSIGVDGYEIGKNGPVRFINWVSADGTAGGVHNRTECMEIDNTSGFVGVHTRRATTAVGNGDPQALFHVNLTNPANSGLNTQLHGIRFEGLPSATPNHTDMIVVDADGNLALSPAGTTIGYGWDLAGNTVTPSDFIGTLNGEDFRIHTNSNPVAKFTQYGNFDLGNNATGSTTTTTSAAIGIGNVLDDVTSAISVGLNNEQHMSTYSAAFGDANNINSSSTGCLATGNGNNISTGNYSMASGSSNIISTSNNVFVNGSLNEVDNSDDVFTGGNANQVDNSTDVLVYGDGNIVDNGSYASGVIGEDNRMHGAHGTFIAGGHSYSDGTYNLLLGNRLRAETSPTAMPTSPVNFTSIMLLGEQVHSDLSRSLTIGFSGNRTMVTTNRGVAVQLDPTSLSTYAPTVNFEVQAGVAPGSTSPLPLPIDPVTGLPRDPLSNIRFHNLPLTPQAFPAVVVDPSTGELYQTSNSYSKPGRGTSGEDLDSLYEENEVLRDRVAQLEAQLSTYDAKFAQLERSITQICENGCGGLSFKDGDALYQSIPNPSDNNTMISYYLANNYSQASISLYSMNGKEIHTYPLVPNEGKGSISIGLGDLASGVYMYRLLVDGKQVGVKRLQKQ